MEDLCERFLTREPLAAVPHEWADHLCERFTTHEPRAERLSRFVGHLCVRFATHERFAALLFTFVEALRERSDALCERFATREPLAAVLHEGREALCERFATHERFAALLFEFVEALRERSATREPLAAHVRTKLARIPDFSALSDPLADIHGELPQVLRDLLPVAGELRRVLVSFFDDIGKILEVRPKAQGRPGGTISDRTRLQSLRPAGVRARNLKK
jgi:hypothetical protein